MPLSLRTKQVAGVTAIVAVAVALLLVWYLTALVRILLDESQARADLVVNTLNQRLFAVVAAGGPDPVAAIQADGGVRSILEASIFAEGVTYAAIVDADDVVIAHFDPAAVGERLPPTDALSALLDRGPVARVWALYARGGRMLEVRSPLLVGETEPIGAIRVGLSTLLIRDRLEDALRAPAVTALVALVAAVLLAGSLAQLVVRPIHVIRGGLARLGRGELDVQVDLPAGGELGDLGDSFKAVSAKIAADRSALAGHQATLESLAGQLEDAVALFAPDGTLLFANPAMRATISGESAAALPDGHPMRALVDRALAGTVADAPATIRAADGTERAVAAHVVRDAGLPVGVLLVARNLAYLSEVESRLSYSRKLAALSRLTAGVAHEIKNPLNATMIHLELLRMHVADLPDAQAHVATIVAQVRRLDEVVQGFLKFTRPEELKPRPVAIADLLAELASTVRAEADRTGVELAIDCPADLAPVTADRSMLLQAFLNLALNACQAMPDGGRLTIAARSIGASRIEVRFEDTGVGIAAADLPRVFDLYFTTKGAGSGIGLSLVYRTVQLHDGDIEVESTPGRGTTFRVILRQAPASVLPLATS